MRNIWILGVAGFVAAAGVVGVVFAQGDETSAPPAQPLKPGIMRLETTLGSFALKGEGRVEMNFRGTILVNGFEGPPPVFEGEVRKEYEGHGRMVWFGRGKAIIEGKWDHLQWFGGDLVATWNGIGEARLYGEFDPVTGKAGSVRVDDEPEYSWHSAGTIHYVPKELHPAWPEIARRRALGLSDAPGLPVRPHEGDGEDHSGHDH